VQVPRLHMPAFIEQHLGERSVLTGFEVRLGLF